MNDFKAGTPLLTLPLDSATALPSVNSSNVNSGTSGLLTVGQKYWLASLAKIAIGFPQSKIADQGPDELTASARVWADELKAVPYSKIVEVYDATMANWTSSFAPSVGDFRAAWQRMLIEIPRETFQEKEAREDAANGFKALMAGKAQMPLFQQIHKNLGRVVVCKCTFQPTERDIATGANLKFITGVRVPAQITETHRGPRWQCPTFSCDFDVDANDEAAVGASTVTPILATATAIAPSVNAAPTINTTRAELFAEQANLNWEGCDEAQRKDLAQMAKWLDWTKRSHLVTPENFPQFWDEFQGKRAKENAQKVGGGT